MKLIKTGAVFILVAALIMTGMPAALAASPPVVQTLKPTHMYVYYAGSYYYPGGDMNAPARWQTEDVRARLQGSVNPGGRNCTVYFEYGITTAYGSTAGVGTVSGTSAVDVSAALTGLRAATLCHCRLVAASDSGIVYGHDLAFIPSCDSYEIYCLKDLNPEHDVLKYWNARFIPSADPTGNIEIVASPNDDQNWAVFDITNHNPFDVTVDYTDSETRGYVIIGTLQTQQIYVPKGSICSFAYNYTLFKQVLTNDQYWNDTPLPRNKVEMYFLGSLANRQAGMYSINNRNAQAVTLDLQTGSDIYTVTVPAGGNGYFLSSSGYEVMASLHDDPDNPFMIVSSAVMKWYGAALVTAEPQGYSDTTATFRLQNNDDTTHSVKLKNADGVTHSYTFAPYEHQTVTIEKSNWDVYMQLSALPQPNIAGWVEDGYVKINSVSPGAAVLPPLAVSGAAVFMSAYGSSDSSLYVTGGGAWTAVSDQPWLTVSPAAGNGFSWLTMTASVNTASSFRNAVVTISDGTTTKTVTVTQTGQGRGNALSFDGADDGVSVPDNDNGITDAFTLQSWVKWEPGAPTDIQFICGKDTEQMELQAGGSANSLRFIPTPGVCLDAAGVLPTGVWTHVAVVYQPSVGMAKMYINGSEVTLTNNGSQPLTTAAINTSASFSLGSRGGGYPFKGALDDFRIWDRALTQNEIRLNMLNPLDPSSQTDLVSAYSFNQGAAAGDNAGVTVLVDETGYRNGGLSGFALSSSVSNWVASGAGEGFHTVTVSADPTEGGSASSGGAYSEGSSVTVTATANSGYTFTNWTEGGSPVSTDAAYTFTLDTINRTLVANFIVTPPDITTGTISGTVTDGANLISGADVSLTVSGSVYSATTAPNGSYSILNVPVGTGYTVTATKTGYNSGSATNVGVTANTTTQNINIALTSAVSTAVTLLSATADGVADTTTSTKIDLTFDTAIADLTASDVTITNGTGAAVKGTLSGSGTSWSIALTSVTTQGNVSVAVSAPTGYSISGSPKPVAVYKAVALTPVTLQAAVADGAANTTTSTKIDFTFDTAIAGLTASDITITNGTGAAVKGALTGSGTSWSIALASVTTQGNVTVAVSAPAGYTISGSPKTVAVYKAAALTPVTLQTALADGVADTTTSTKIDLTFDTAIAGLTTSDITNTDGSGAVVKGALTGSGTNWSIALASVTTQGNVSVAVSAPAGYTISGSPKTVAVYKAAVPIVTVTSVTVAPPTVSVQKGTTQTFTAAVNGTNSPAQTVTWSVYGNTSVSTTISASGLLTVAADETAATLTVTATSTVDNSKSGTATVTVTTTPPAFVAVTDITGVPATATAGTPLTLTGTVAPAGATNQTVVWSVYNAGDTGVSIVGNTLSTTAAGIVVVRAAITNGLTESTDYTQDFNITVAAAPVTTYTVTASADNGGSISPNGAVNVAEGSSQTFTITSNSGYRINSVTVDGVNQGAITTYIFANVTANHTITATFTRTSGRGGGGGGGSPSTPATPAAPTYNADVKAGNSTETTLPVTVDKDKGTASTDVGSQKLTSSGTVITVPSIPDVNAYSVGIPVPDLSTSDVQGTLTLHTDNGSVTVPSNMLTGVSDISGSKAEITIGQGNKEDLPEDVKAAIGDRPLVQLTLSIDGKQTDWNNRNAPVTVSISYTPTAAERANPESIVVWYIDGSGKVVTVPNGHYDPATGRITFDTTHFSDYAVAYNPVSFNDVASGTWYNKAVDFIAARGITSGTGNGKYSPEAKLTRGEFIVLMMRAYGIAPDTDLTNNFADAGNTYYTGYLAAAKRLGISGGVGNNMYAPGNEITRQEMYTLLYNVLKVIGQLPGTHGRAVGEANDQPQGDSGKSLSNFSDAGQIASWAKDAMTLLVETGTLGGNNGMLIPTSTTTRAEMAQVVYNLLSK